MNTKLSKKDILYPSQLKSIKNPPKVLYYKGKITGNTFDKCIAVVGSRRMTEYGRKICDQLVFELSSSGITIVSGFMYGIDITAHRAALLAGGSTIAVMPCGINTVVPAYEASLHEQIQHKGLVLSEYPDNTAPKYWTFVQRNRIVAGLSKAVLVIEAAEDSGSLITAEYSYLSDRPVFAVPGNLNSNNSRGTLNLIKQNKATMLLNSAEIISLFDTTPNLSNNASELILEHLNTKKISIPDLCTRLNLPAKHIVKELALLQIKGKVFENGGLYSAYKS